MPRTKAVKKEVVKKATQPRISEPEMQTRALHAIGDWIEEVNKTLDLINDNLHLISERLESIEKTKPWYKFW